MIRQVKMMIVFLLMGINISNAKTHTSLTTALQDPQNVTVLHLDGNDLDILPSEIGQLTNLVRLNLNNNQLTALPPEIGQLSSLRWLSLENNNLSTLPPEI